MDVFIAALQAVMKHFGPTAKPYCDPLKVEFQKNEITLAIPNVGELNREGWKITPISSPAIVSFYCTQVCIRFLKGLHEPYQAFIHYYKHIGSCFNTKPCVELLCKHLSSVYSTQCTTNGLLQCAISNNYTCRVIFTTLL